MKSAQSGSPKLLIMASRGARWDPSSPLLRFIRDHVSILKRFEIHATKGTYHSILSTGLYQKENVITHRAGPEGGVVEMATLVAHKNCEVLIFFLIRRIIRQTYQQRSLYLTLRTDYGRSISCATSFL